MVLSQCVLRLVDSNKMLSSSIQTVSGVRCYTTYGQFYLHAMGAHMHCQAPIDFMQRGVWEGEEIGLALIGGYDLFSVTMEPLVRISLLGWTKCCSTQCHKTIWESCSHQHVT